MGTEIYPSIRLDGGRRESAPTLVEIAASGKLRRDVPQEGEERETTTKLANHRRDQEPNNPAPNYPN
jgi:hypothetical protein